MESGLAMSIGQMMMCTEMTLASFACGCDASRGWQRLVSSVHRHSFQRGLIGNANDIRATAHSLRRTCGCGGLRRPQLDCSTEQDAGRLRRQADASDGRLIDKRLGQDTPHQTSNDSTSHAPTFKVNEGWPDCFCSGRDLQLAGTHRPEYLKACIHQVQSHCFK